MAEAPKAATNGFFLGSFLAASSREKTLCALNRCENKGLFSPDRAVRMREAVNRAFDKKESGTMEKDDIANQLQYEVGRLNGIEVSDETISRMHHQFDLTLAKALDSAKKDPASRSAALRKTQEKLVVPKTIDKLYLKCSRLECLNDDLNVRTKEVGYQGLQKCKACPEEDAAYYCSTECYKADWAKHKVTCVGMKRCQGPECTKLDHVVRKVNKKGLQLCSQCKTSSYCSRECQVAHWKAGHKEACQPRG